MVSTVIEAFESFQRDSIDLNAADVALARRSRDWLFARIRELPTKDNKFPLLYEEKDIVFGSFSRGTKIYPLDDIDMMSCLHADGATYLAYQHDDVRVTVPSTSRLHAFCHENTDLLNSRKVVNKYVSALATVPQYRRAGINRRQEAATLQLASYSWNFDVVPALFTTPEGDGRTYYLIPNGDGHWKKTDPRIDHERVNAVNQQHDGHMLKVLRCVKFWQQRPVMVSMPSYLLECMIVDYFEYEAERQASQFVDLELSSIFDYISTAIHRVVPDPKGITFDLNNVAWDDRISIFARATRDAAKAEAARDLERGKDMKASIEIWREVFGGEFPEYG